MDVGLDVSILLEKIAIHEMLSVSVTNTDVLDMTSETPILQSFENRNIIDVQERMTYQIADFVSQSSQLTKGFFKKNEYSTEVTNKIFISYGD